MWFIILRSTVYWRDSWFFHALFKWYSQDCLQALKFISGSNISHHLMDLHCNLLQYFVYKCDTAYSMELKIPLLLAWYWIVLLLICMTWWWNSSTFTKFEFLNSRYAQHTFCIRVTFMQLQYYLQNFGNVHCHTTFMAFTFLTLKHKTIGRTFFPYRTFTYVVVLINEPACSPLG